ncbi:MAG: hypothetical protein SPD95_07070 [Candidatus Faecousia sp.]|nr:hypothetical protein [Candidatus Faecousia sp.]
MEGCPCKWSACPRYGDCAACWAHHHGSERKPLTRCEKLAQKEQCKAEKLVRRGQRKAR